MERNNAVVLVGSTALLKVKVTGAETETPVAPFAGSLVMVWARNRPNPAKSKITEKLSATMDE